MSFFVGTLADHLSNGQTRIARPPSPPSEVWDNDDDFDFSSLSGNALELPRSEIGSDDFGRGNVEHEDEDEHVDNDRGNEQFKIEPRLYNDNGDDFAETMDDEDQVDTIKISELAAATLAQLAQLKKKPDSLQDSDNSGLRNELLGKVTNLSHQSLNPFAVEMEAGMDWDEDLEVPDTFPSLRFLPNSSGFGSDIDFETPSIGSTDDATTSGSVISDVHGKGSCKSFQGISEEGVRSSTSSYSSAYASPNKKKVGEDVRASKEDHEISKSRDEEEDFDLPGELTMLQLASSKHLVRIDTQIDQPGLLWGENDGQSKAFHHNSALSSSTGELSAKYSDKDDSHQGLFTAGDLNLIVSIVQAEGQSTRVKDAALQEKKEKDTHNTSSLLGQAEVHIRHPSTTREDKESTARPALSSFSSSKKLEMKKTASSELSSTSRLLASTKASRARESGPRSESPRPSQSFESTSWSKVTTSVTQEGHNSRLSSSRNTSSRRQQSQESAFIHDRPMTPSVIYTKDGAVTRYSMSTAASRARQADASRTSISSHLGSPAVTRLMRGPKRPRVYGTGRELEGFEDLPVHRERETELLQVDEKKSNNQAPRLKAKVMVSKVTPVRSSLSVSASAKSPLSTALSTDEMPARLSSSSQGYNQRQPTLIRKLGNPDNAPRIEGSHMKWNANLRKWEGNEEEGRALEKAIQGTGQRKLITRLPSSSRSKVPTSPPSIVDRIVGDMIFDPIRLCWLNKNKEDEVNPFAAMDDESDVEEGHDNQGSSRLKARTTQLKGKTSTASLRQRSDAESPQWSVSAIDRVLRNSKGEVPKSLTNRIPTSLWKECIATKLRHDEEMTPFLPTKEAQTQTQTQKQTKRMLSPARDRSSHLYLIQSLARKAASG